MTRLSVNINKVALIRNSRGSNLPNLKQFALDCEEFGAQGITVHPRPDQRHVRFDDLPVLKECVTTEFNVEGYPSEKFVKMVLDCAPHQCTLVPDPPGVLTSNEGWKIKEHSSLLNDVIGRMHEKNIRVSLFADASPSAAYEAKQVNADRIELYTGKYAEDFYIDKFEAIEAHVECSKEARNQNIGLNAGHDLNLDNLYFYKSQMVNLMEVSIGHAIVSDALYFGIKNTIQMYLHELSRK